MSSNSKSKSSDLELREILSKSWLLEAGGLKNLGIVSDVRSNVSGSLKSKCKFFSRATIIGTSTPTENSGQLCETLISGKNGEHVSTGSGDRSSEKLWASTFSEPSN